MARRATFFIGRINKGGNLTTESLIRSLLDPEIVPAQSYSWTIIDGHRGRLSRGERSTPFVSGRLAKFQPDAIVRILNPKTKRVLPKHEPNLEAAASQFVYLPDEQIISFRHIWNQITAADFTKRFKQIVEKSHDNFFVDCSIVLLSDERAFIRRVAELHSIEEIKATVRPPNPLYGVHWRSLQLYLDRRDVSELRIKEESKRGASLKSDLPDLARAATRGSATNSSKQDQSLDIADAAALMATDGYGTAHVIGTGPTGQVIIRTSDKVERMKLDPEVVNAELARAVINRIRGVNHDRKLRH